MQLTDVEAKYAVFNKERFKRYALFICQGVSWRLDDLINWLEEEDNETQDNRSSRARGKAKAAPKRRSARK